MESLDGESLITMVTCEPALACGCSPRIMQKALVPRILRNLPCKEYYMKSPNSRFSCDGVHAMYLASTRLPKVGHLPPHCRGSETQSHSSASSRSVLSYETKGSRQF